jgi:hypothetical protein
MSNAYYWLYAVNGTRKVPLVTPAGMVGGEPPTITIRAGETVKVVSLPQKTIPRIASSTSGVVRIEGSTIQGLRPGETTIAAEGINYCSDQRSQAETCALLTLIVRS